MENTLLRVENLSVGIKKTGGTAVNGINLELKKGEVMGVVGESGCGKTFTALSIMGLLPQTAQVTGGIITFDGVQLTGISQAQIRKIQGKDISMVFQEPMTSLDPLMKIGAQTAENLRVHTRLSKKEREVKAAEVLKKVGFTQPQTIMNRYPHELSGGMRQRVMIASAIICHPKLIICDEPTTALDVTSGTRILSLIAQINKEYGCAVLFISHDLSVIRRICSRVAVMYAGSIVEAGDTETVFSNPAHPYTKGLLGAIPGREKRGRRLANITGTVPPVTCKRVGCAFAPRCPIAQQCCKMQNPSAVNLGHGHTATCFCVKEDALNA